jgi:hypothetical protein
MYLFRLWTNKSFLYWHLDFLNPAGLMYQTDLQNTNNIFEQLPHWLQKVEPGYVPKKIFPCTRFDFVMVSLSSKRGWGTRFFCIGTLPGHFSPGQLPPSSHIYFAGRGLYLAISRASVCTPVCPLTEWEQAPTVSWLVTAGGARHFFR